MPDWRQHSCETQALQDPTKLCHCTSVEKNIKRRLWRAFFAFQTLQVTQAWSRTKKPQCDAFFSGCCFVITFPFYSSLSREAWHLLCWKINITPAVKQPNLPVWPTNGHSSLYPPILLSQSAAVLLRWVGPRQLLRRISILSGARALLHTDASFIREVSSHRRCGLVMISRDYGWLMVGKYIRNHGLRDGEGISLTLVDLHWSTANEWGLAASSYLPTDK